MLLNIPKKGERVIFLPLRIKGTITYVDYRNIYNHHFYPIQVELDEPWDPAASQRMIRGSMLEFRKLKKKKRVKKKLIHLTTRDMKEAFLQLNFLFTTRSIIDYKPSSNKFRNGHYLSAFNILLEAEHCDTDLKLEEIGYKRRKTNHLLRSYLDPAEYKHWMRLIKKTTEKYHRVVSDIVLTTTKNSKHTNGPCLLGFSFNSYISPVLTVYSRSVELPQPCAADTILIAAKEVSFSKLVRLKDEYKRIIIEKKEPEQYTGTKYFIERLKKGDW